MKVKKRNTMSLDYLEGGGKGNIYFFKCLYFGVECFFKLFFYGKKKNYEAMIIKVL